ncbi:VOC family protein [Henriciella sp. AS95]|uniref:VOC family protein n=1 Tax=Henriciella sp. AS95 TaxID=3135782 RepID=UPI00317ECB38
MIIAPRGSPLHAAVIGVKDMETSLSFYRDVIGLEVLEQSQPAKGGFGSLWPGGEDLPSRCAVLADRGLDVGRLLLIEFEGGSPEPVRTVPDSNAYGLMNLNFYTGDIRGDAERIGAMGYSFWSDPVKHTMQEEVGSPTEVIFDGPDNLIINLVELSTSDPDTRIGQMRRYVHEELGLNDSGFTPIVTSLHASPDMEADIRFYRDVLGMEVLFRDTLSDPDQNRFSRFPEGSSTRCAFLQGNHMFGKICMTQPVDYDAPSMVARAVAPNFGYLGQLFRVEDLPARLAAADATGASGVSGAGQIHVPGLGAADVSLLRSPGSGALVGLVETL